jgi:hypothetical protein
MRADYAITHRLTPFISMQNHYNLLYREEEREMMPTLKVRPSSLPNPFPRSLLLFPSPANRRCSTSASARSRGRRSRAAPWHGLQTARRRIVRRTTSGSCTAPR